MKERPILFSAPMVRALLDGSKTQTRRVMKPQPQPWLDEGWSIPKFCASKDKGFREYAPNLCPYGKPGDRLWVRETWKLGQARYIGGWVDCAQYRATPGTLKSIDDEIKNAAWETRWRPSIHMPRWASRITLEITGVRVERLRQITVEDSIAEGVHLTRFGCFEHRYPVEACKTAIDGYRELWESINGAGSWDANPWVWVVEFKRLLQEVRNV